MIADLSLGEQFWPILALDHGLTMGHDDSVAISALPGLLNGCKETIGSVVMTYGLARVTRSYNALPLIIQCFGAPLENPKVQVCGVERALSLGAKGVAVQVDFRLSGDPLRSQIDSVSSLVGHAHAANLPVLFMIAPDERANHAQLLRSIRFCIELGADLIKVRVNVLSSSHNSRFDGVDAGNAPPILLAGGAASDNILAEVAAAREIGFSGYCIGRNIFQADDATRMARKLCEAW